MHPILIAGVALVGLPILLHFLLKQEPKKLQFPALRFLKIKQKISERKMRLKHLLLLLLRCLLIALFALTLYQPSLLTTGSFQLSGDQPVAAVIIVDTSPSMGYTVVGETRLDEARKRAEEFLGELPENSKVAILEVNEPVANWEPTLFEAKTRLGQLKSPAGSAPPITTALAAAYQLLKTADADLPEGSEPLPRVVAVFSDRTAGSWDAGRVEELQKLRDTVPKPAPLQLFFDVGVANPVNYAILGAEMRPQLVSGSNAPVVSLTLRAEGILGADEIKLAWSIDDAAPTDRLVKLTNGTARIEQVTLPVQAPGFHTVKFKLARDDAMPFDNERSVTFQVAPPRKILTITDDVASADAWDLAHIAKGEYQNTVATPQAVPALKDFEAVTVLGVAEPSQELADTLTRYVRSGGKLLLIPDGPGSTTERAGAYNKAFEAVLPATLGDLAKWDIPNEDRKRRFGVSWKLDDDADFKHPLLSPLKDMRRVGNVDIFAPSSRRVASRYRKVAGTLPDNAVVVAKLDDSDNDSQRSPILLERTIDTGRVLLLLSRFDFDASTERNFWNDDTKSDHTWATVLPWLLMRHLVGSPEEASFNFPAGSNVDVPLPPTTPRSLRYQGPGISSTDSVVTLTEKQYEWRASGLRTQNAGTFALLADGWKYQFSLFSPVTESTLSKVPEESIVELFGPNSVANVDRKVVLRDLIEQRYDKRLELFPFLLLLVLAFFVIEGFVANRFYKSR